MLAGNVSASTVNINLPESITFLVTVPVISDVLSISFVMLSCKVLPVVNGISVLVKMQDMLEEKESEPESDQKSDHERIILDI